MLAIIPILADMFSVSQSILLHIIPSKPIKKIVIKKENPQDLVKAIEILMRREKTLSEKDPKALKEIFEEEKNMFKDLI